MTEENFKVLLLVEGGRREQRENCVLWLWNDSLCLRWEWWGAVGVYGVLLIWVRVPSWVCDCELCDISEISAYLYFKKVISFNSSRNSFKEMRYPLKLCCMCLVLMLLYLNIYFIIVQTLCISIQNNQSWVLNTIHILSYFVWHLF